MATVREDMVSGVGNRLVTFPYTHRKWEERAGNEVRLLS